MALVRDIDAGNAWAVGRFDVISNRARLPQQLASQLPPINWFAASGHVNGGVQGFLRAEARDEMAAQDLREVVRGFLALARLQAGRDTQIRAMMNSLELGGDGRTVSLGLLARARGHRRARRAAWPAHPPGSRIPSPTRLQSRRRSSPRT